MLFARDQMKQIAAELAAKGVFIGTSSWKYPGWLGQIYSSARYEYRGKIAKSRFERNCLSEYAEVLKTVCVDAAYYTFPSCKYLEALASQVPSDFQFGFKVTDEITVKKFPNLDRFGIKAGRPNENFLNADLFESAFLKPCQAIRPHVGILIFEFTRFHSSDYARMGAIIDMSLGSVKLSISSISLWNTENGQLSEDKNIACPLSRSARGTTARQNVCQSWCE